MQHKTIKTYLNTLAVTLLLSSSVFADDKQDGQPLNYVTSETLFNQTSSDNSDPNSVVTLDFSVHAAESWDIRGRPNNVIENCINGSLITGFKWNDIRVETVGSSYFSEATMHFTNSTGSGGAKVYVGFGNEATGTSYFSSDGIFDLTDNFVSDVASASDQKFLIEFYESVDDSSNSIDAKYTSGTIEVHGVDLIAAESCPFISNEVLTSDLSVSIGTESTASRIGDEVNLLVTVQNSGAAEATNVKLNYIIPSQIELNSYACSDGSTGAITENQLNINLQNLNASESVSCDLVTHIIGYGRINNAVTISADNDADSSNNNGNVVLGGSAYSIPVNNWLALSLFILFLSFTARKKLL
jgi:uncharacterized repeat protein (TIGR01451 family)